MAAAAGVNLSVGSPLYTSARNVTPRDESDLPSEALPFMDQLHRRMDAFVVISSKASGSWVELGGIPCEKLGGVIPKMAKTLEKNSYMSVNSQYRSRYEYDEMADGRRVPYTGTTGLARVDRSAANARYLNACYCDVDLHEDPSKYWHVFADFMMCAERGDFPIPSMVVRSGRGFVPLWLLRDKYEPAIPQRAFPDKIELYGKVQRGIVTRLSGFGADIAAVDVARCIRFPGSINTDAPEATRRVGFTVNYDGSGQPFHYKLEEMAVAFGVELPAWRNFERGKVLALPSPQRAVKKHAYRCGQQKRLAGFERLRRIRGRFTKGVRTYAACLYASMLRKCKFQVSDIEFRVNQFASEHCEPRLSASDVKKVMAQSAKYVKTKPVRYIEIKRLLAVTHEEERLIPEWTRKTPLRLRSTTRRRGLVGEIAGRCGALPSCRQMVQLLAARGERASHVSVYRDYRALGLLREPEHFQEQA